jgi:hypothetical protein
MVLNVVHVVGLFASNFAERRSDIVVRNCCHSDIQGRTVVYSEVLHALQAAL